MLLHKCKHVQKSAAGSLNGRLMKPYEEIQSLLLQIMCPESFIQSRKETLEEQKKKEKTNSLDAKNVAINKEVLQFNRLFIKHPVFMCSPQKKMATAGSPAGLSFNNTLTFRPKGIQNILYMAGCQSQPNCRTVHFSDFKGCHDLSLTT